MTKQPTQKPPALRVVTREEYEIEAGTSSRVVKARKTTKRKAGANETR